MQYEKICKNHGELDKDNIIVETNKSAKRGYTLRCRLCKLDKDRKWKELNWEQHKESASKARNQARKDFREGKINIEPKANSWEREDRKKNPQKYRLYEKNYINKHGIEKVRKMEVARIHGLTIDAYDALINSRNGLCDICGKEEKMTARGGHLKPLSIDHCHKSEEKGIYKIRGLLCHNCNVLIGHANDDILTLQSAIQYLQQHEHIKDDSTGVTQ